MRAHTSTQNKGVTVHYCEVVGIQHCDTTDNTTMNSIRVANTNYMNHSLVCV